MRIAVGDTRLYFDVDGAKLVPEGPWMRERPTVLLLHPGPGFDHGLFKVQVGPSLVPQAQVVYLDQRGGGRSDPAEPEALRLDRWADDVRELCDALGIERPIVLGLGFGSLVAIRYASRHPGHAGGLVLAAPVARMVPERSIAVYERLGGAAAREVAERFYGGMDERAFADFLRVCFPLLSSYELTSDVIIRADWRPDVLMGWMLGEARELDLRDELARLEAPTLVLAGEDDAWAPLASVEEVVRHLPEAARFRSFPGARHSVFRDAPAAVEELHRFLASAKAGEATA
ncbi:MAG: alpha/beta hydrolase [Actinobacteria bacterium]|nr:alpha/beta hydrolase [Actinomycetota bacterium]